MARSLVRFAACRNLWHSSGTQRLRSAASGATKTLVAAEQPAHIEPSNKEKGTAQHHLEYGREDLERFNLQFWQDEVDAFERLTRRKQREQLREEFGLSRRSITALCVSCHLRARHHFEDAPTHTAVCQSAHWQAFVTLTCNFCKFAVCCQVEVL